MFKVFMILYLYIAQCQGQIPGLCVERGGVGALGRGGGGGRGSKILIPQKKVYYFNHTL